ncbi:MAG TPA: metallophosphoesterase [Acidobacteriaceae bacterium]|nr:metallophosphoesterase [Acidobacteriaceae bacterium]
MPGHLTTRLTRRRFLQLAGASSVGLLAYAGEFERHHLEITHRTVRLARLSPALDGLRIAHLSDFHYEQYTEPYFIREVVAQVNRQTPDLVLMTGDFISEGPASDWRDAEMSFPCAETLSGIQCPQRWCVLGNHDATVGPDIVTQALNSHGHPVLANAHVPFERNGARLWLAGVKDVGVSAPDLNLAAPRGLQTPDEPVILMAHEPDYADRVIQHGGVDLMLSGHTHGGQIRVPMIGALYLPKLGRKYVEGHFSLGNGLQLYVNRGIGSVGVPFRFYCRPELTMITLRTEQTA